MFNIFSTVWMQVGIITFSQTPNPLPLYRFQVTMQLW